MRRGTKALFILLFFIGVSTSLVVWEGCSRAEQVIDWHEKDVEERIAALRAQDFRRPALGGPEEPGNAWDLLVQGLTGIKSLPEADVQQIPRLSDDPGLTPDPAKLETVFAAAAPHVDLLRQALRRAEFRPDYKYEDGAAIELPYVARYVPSARLMSGWMDHLHSLGKDREAMELLRVILGTAHDAGREGVLLNALIMAVAEQTGADAAKDILAAHSLDAKDLEALAADLDLLAGSRPSMSSAFAREGIVLRRSLVMLARGEGQGVGMPAIPAGVPGFGRISLSGALNVFEKAFKDLEAMGSLPAHERAAALVRIGQEAMDSKNQLVLLLMPATSKAHKREAVAEMHGTLLRVSVAIAWHEEEKGAFPANLEDLVPRHLPNVPRCPLTGQPLLYADGKVWSPGWDGDDDGGKQAPEEDQDGDEVWTVKRRGK